MRLLSLSFVLIIFGTTFSINAGVTIYYEGKAVSSNAVSKILKIASQTAKENMWRTENLNSEKGRLVRVINEKNNDYEGRITGIKILISKTCEPIFIQFGDDLFMQDFVKTQFAGADVHIQIIQMLELMRPHFEKFQVSDEGEYWDTHDRSKLVNHLETVNSMMRDIKKKNPKAKGPVFLKSGRIVDIME